MSYSLTILLKFWLCLNMKVLETSFYLLVYDIRCKLLYYYCFNNGYGVIFLLFTLISMFYLLEKANIDHELIYNGNNDLWHKHLNMILDLVFFLNPLFLTKNGCNHINFPQFLALFATQLRFIGCKFWQAIFMIVPRKTACFQSCLLLFH